MFRRGFKTWSEQTSLRAREKLKLSAASPLDPFRLADFLEVIVLQPGDLSDLAHNIRFRLGTVHSDCWSAITVSCANRHLIVLNSSHAKTRLNSSLAHELAHIILGHEPSMMFMSSNSGTALRTYNEDQEEEANWLGGCLLLPRDALIGIGRKGTSDEDACTEYGVSPAMLRFRCNVTGVTTHLRRIAGYNQGPRRSPR